MYNKKDMCDDCHERKEYIDKFIKGYTIKFGDRLLVSFKGGTCYNIRTEDIREVLRGIDKDLDNILPEKRKKYDKVDPKGQ